MHMEISRHSNRVTIRTQKNNRISRSWAGPPSRMDDTIQEPSVAKRKVTRTYGQCMCLTATWVLACTTWRLRRLLSRRRAQHAVYPPPERLRDTGGNVGGQGRRARPGPRTDRSHTIAYFRIASRDGSRIRRASRAARPISTIRGTLECSGSHTADVRFSCHCRYLTISLPLANGVRELLICNARQMCCLMW